MNYNLPLPKICFYHSQPCSLIRYLILIKLFAPLQRTCESCNRQQTMNLVRDDDDIDKYYIYCSTCAAHFSVRKYSIFFNSNFSLYQLLILLSCFINKVTILSTSLLLDISRQAVSHWFKIFRSRIHDYMLRNPIVFDHHDVVEVDEAWITGVGELITGIHYNNNNAGWVLGMVSRITNKRVIEPLTSRSRNVIYTLISQHIPPDTVIFTDELRAYNTLLPQWDWYAVSKWNLGSASGPITYPVIDDEGRSHRAHTNTIEGMWSILRDELHHSRGYIYEYLPLILSEFMFRSLNISFSTVFKYQM